MSVNGSGSGGGGVGVASEKSGVGVSVPSDVSSSPQGPSFVQREHATYSPFTAYCFTVNYILGVGVLGMPFAFAASGWLLSAGVLALLSLFAWVTGMWIVQVQQRAKHNIRMQYAAAHPQWADALLNGHSDVSSQPTRTSYSDAHSDTQLLLDNGDGRPAGTASSVESSSSLSESFLSPDAIPAPPTPTHTHPRTVYTPSLVDRRLELNELIGFYNGRHMQRAYEVCLSILIVGALWAYCAVFAGSMAVQLPPIRSFLPSSVESCSGEESLNGGCAGLYYFYLAIFALVVVPLTCRELTELKWMMIVLAAFRFVSLGLMMITAVHGIWSYPANPPTPPQPSGQPPYYGDTRAVVLSGLGVVLPIAMSSQLFHHAIPNLSFPLRPQAKVPHVFSAVLCTTFSLYAALGICVSLFFGSSVQSNCTLSWHSWTGNESIDLNSRSGFASFVAYLIVLFPPIDVLSAFPLNGITLANNIMAAFVTPEQATQRRYILPFRLLASLLPVVGAAIVKDLSTILHYTGCIGILIGFIFPAALQYQSLKRMQQAKHAADAGELNVAPQSQPSSERAFDGRSFSLSAAVRSADVPSRELIIGGGLANLLNSPLSIYSVTSFAVVGLVAVVVLSIIDR